MLNADRLLPRPAEKQSHRAIASFLYRLGQVVASAFLLPAAIYFAVFILFTWPLMGRFSEGFFCDAGDGLQNVWNLWWTKHALVDEPQWPFFTLMLHAPSGVTLWGHTLTIFNGILCAGLMRFLTLVQAHNVVFVFSFVMAGVTAFWLVREIARSYWGAIVGGGVFAFSAYHFAHTQGHMNLLALEWLPLAALTGYRFVNGPSAKRAAALAAALFLNVLCDYHYFAYAMLILAIMAAWKIRQERAWGYFLAPARWKSVLWLGMFFTVSSGTVIATLLWSHLRDHLETPTSLSAFSMDLLAPFIPGGHWRFAPWTAWYWGRLPANVHESSVYVGIAVLIFCGLAAWSVRRQRRASTEKQTVILWGVIWWIGFLLALGPWLRIWGYRVGVPMPYMLLMAVPLMRVPVRFIAMTSVASAVLVGLGWRHLAAQKTIQASLALAMLLVLLVIEMLPSAVPVTFPEVPAYVQALKDVRSNVAILDDLSNPCAALYFQTIHQKRLALGYISRVPRSVSQQDAKITASFAAGDYATLKGRFAIDYLVVREPREHPQLQLLFLDAEAAVYKIRP